MRTYISYENITPQIVKCELHIIPNLISEDLHSNFLDGNMENFRAQAWNVFANYVFLVGKLTQVFQMLNREHSVFDEGKTSQIFSNYKYEKIPCFMWPCLDIWHRYFCISFQRICIQISITLTKKNPHFLQIIFVSILSLWCTENYVI